MRAALNGGDLSDDWRLLAVPWTRGTANIGDAGATLQLDVGARERTDIRAGIEYIPGDGC